ncbi:MAG: DUF5317 family protein [Cellulosilyticaceae bacterium]
MLETWIVVLLISYKKGNDISCVWKEKSFYPIILCELLYWILQLGVFNNDYNAVAYGGVLKTVYLCTTLFIVFRFELYRYAIIGAICVILGGWCNDLAIAANGGYMPVFPTLSLMTGYVKIEAFGVADQLHVLGNNMTQMKVLTDIFDIGYSVLSVGDILIRVLPFVVVYQGIKKATDERNKMMTTPCEGE